MDMKEHISQYDPKVGHFDKNTNAKGFNYFFLGNGNIEVALQYNKSGKGTPLGLAIMDPDNIGKKSDVYTYDQNYGFERTMVTLKTGKEYHAPHAENLKMYWGEESHIPAVVANWECCDVMVSEVFICPSKELPQLLRMVVIGNKEKHKLSGTLSIDMAPSSKIPKAKNLKFDVAPEGETIYFFLYELEKEKKNVKVSIIDDEYFSFDNEEYWSGTNFIDFNNEKLNQLFFASKSQIAATISSKAKMDASVWQYNREWVRDMSNVALGNLYSGHTEVSRKILQRLIDEFIDESGSSVDSSLIRPVSEVELDQNGILLYAVWQYRVWTDDTDIIKKNWDKIKALAEFPLQDCFWDKKSRLLKNCREYWERHDAHGVTDGYEMTYQMFPVLGLDKASEMAKELGETALAKRWKDASKEIWNAFLKSPKFAMIENGSIIKRRKADGSWHSAFEPIDRKTLPEGTPLREEYLNTVDPDASSALPIAFNMIDSKGKLALNTLKALELLWNQRWNQGGYGRYNIKSEPDSPGPWPFATMFITRAYFESENREKVIRNLNWMMEMGDTTGSWFEFYGWRPIPPCPPPGIIPWNWAEVIICLVYNMLGIRPEKDKIVIRPKILNLTDKISGSFIIAGKELNFKINISAKNKTSYALLNKKTKIEFKNGQIEIPKNISKMNLEIFMSGK